MSQVTVKIATSTNEFAAIEEIRKTVFQEEQGVDAVFDFDGLDETCDRLIASLNGEFIGTVRIRVLNPEMAKIERLAVLKQGRGYGIGKKLMAEALEIAKSKGILEVVIHAQEYIKPLHQQLGFEEYGDVFVSSGIRHVKMRKVIKNEE
ncbi:GNAT family N-acetyltransferase [Brunnivagina elsteri]|uniref:GNAT family N-acetyltransferase n=1 Tax=Brunnivagina elsteri CCALA 953 TaxID=987040 RepID=A0A2A2TJG4_9CYAN|nr:GNAT family N-acetyltransferase [Calothrix elsteri]PAX53798.1 GNAT family N-acetyltransferase [Calothrix elsteri CCALA 953]